MSSSNINSLFAGAIRINSIWVKFIKLSIEQNCTQNIFTVDCNAIERNCCSFIIRIIEFFILSISIHSFEYATLTIFLFMLVVIYQYNYHLLWNWRFPCGKLVSFHFIRENGSMYREVWRVLKYLIGYSIILSANSSLIRE